MLQFYRCKKGLLLSLTFLLFSLTALSQTVLKGTVKDAKGTLPGVSVKIKEAPQIGVVTNNNGEFSIPMAASYKTLVVSFIGYKTQEFTIGTRATVVITLEENLTGLNEVVVLGYNTSAKKDLTGSVAVVSVTDLQKAPVQSFTEALAGRVPGVLVSSPDGKPGSTPTIVIRGLGSISQDSSPLFVIDGVPIESPDNNLIDPANIESMTVLKDASATAIYGSRGGNGVIVITTKRGSKGPSQVSYNGYYGVNQPYKYMKLLSPYEFVRLASDQFGTAANPYLADGRTLEDYRNVKGNDLQDQLLRTGTMSNHSIFISGGSENGNYAISGNYVNQTGIVIASDYTRYQGKISLDQKVGAHAKVGGFLTYTRNMSRGGDPAPGLVNSLFLSVYGYRPIPTPGNANYAPQDAVDLYDPDNVYPLDARVNPLINYSNELRNRINKNMLGNLFFDYDLAKGLRLHLQGNINSTDSRTEAFNNTKTRSGGRFGTQGVNGSILNGTIDIYTNTNLLQYNTVIADKHRIGATAGLEMQKTNFKSFGYSAIQIPDESLGISGLDAGTINQTNANARLSTNSLYSAFGQVTYNYASKYYLTATYRADGSSKFSPKNRWGYFPSASAKWKFSEENFMKGQSIISDANIRASYGTSGNNRVDDFAYAQVLNFTSQLYLNGGLVGPNAVVSTLPNDNLKWETNVQSNVAVDLSFLNDRLILTVEYYHNKIKDLLYRTPLPGSTGYVNSFRNIASLSNRGWEISLGGEVVKSTNFSYNTNFNISFNKNRLDALSDPSEEGIISTVNWDANFTSTPAFISKIGGPLGQVYGFVFDGIYQYSDFDRTPGGSYILKNNIPANTNARASVQPGQEKYVDLNNDGIINDNDRTVIGNGYPIHVGGWNNNLNYKNFDINIFFQWSYGNDIINANRIWFNGGQATYRSNYGPQGALAEFAERWTPNNPSNTMARIGQNNRVYSTKYTEDGSYIRLKTLNFGYTIPKKWVEKYKINRLRVYVSANNLITLTGYKGYDPEVSTYATALSPTLDYSSYPRPVTVTAGVNLSL
jgi:TonB-linked SusC/RagA family outer membrane protein